MKEEQEELPDHTEASGSSTMLDALSAFCADKRLAVKEFSANFNEEDSTVLLYNDMSLRCRRIGEKMFSFELLLEEATRRYILENHQLKWVIKELFA